MRRSDLDFDFIDGGVIGINLAACGLCAGVVGRRRTSGSEGCLEYGIEGFWYEENEPETGSCIVEEVGVGSDAKAPV